MGGGSGVADLVALQGILVEMRGRLEELGEVVEEQEHGLDVLAAVGGAGGVARMFGKAAGLGSWGLGFAQGDYDHA